MIRKTLEGLIGAIVLLALAWGGQWLYYRWTEPPPEAELFRVLDVIDGDEIIVGYHGQRALVRYIGINAPEVNHPTRGLEPGEAAAVNRELVGGKWASLELTAESGTASGASWPMSGFGRLTGASSLPTPRW